MNLSRSPNEQQVWALQEEMRTTLEQVKALGNIITPGDIKVYESNQLRWQYIIKLKRGICILEMNENNFSQKKNITQTLKQTPKETISEKQIEDNTIRIIYFQIKELKGHAEQLKEKLKYSLKEANDEKLFKKEERDQALDLQECMYKKSLKISTLNRSARLNMQRQRE